MKVILSLLSILTFVSFPLFSSAGGDPAEGDKLIQEIKCGKCHRFTEQGLVGPGLKGVTKRHSEAWLKKWLGNPQAAWEENDEETQQLKRWREGRLDAKKTNMKIRALSPEEIEHIIAFLKKNDEG